MAYLFVDGQDRGHIGLFFHNPDANLQLPGGAGINLYASYTEGREFRTSHPDVYRLWLAAKIKPKRYKPGVALLTIEYASALRPADYWWSHQHAAIIRPLPHYRERLNG